MLARLFARPANVLVMDEPTNDLDIETLELLEELIADFPGTVLLVSHDRAFLDNIVTSTLAFEGDGRVVEYVGGWGDYLRQREQRLRTTQPGDPAQRPRPERGAKSPRESERGWAASAKATASSAEASRRRGPASIDKSRPGSLKKPDVSEGPQSRKLSFKEQREFESLPARIEALEDEQRRLTEESVAPDFYKAGGDRISGVLARIERLTAEHEAALARWLELEERAVPHR